MRHVQARYELIGIATLVIAVLGAGCTLKPSGSSTLTITLPDQLPQSRSAMAAFSGAQGVNALTSVFPWTSPISSKAQSAPQPTLAGYTCFGVNVSGPGIFADPRMSCGPSGNAGVVGGLVPVMNGAQISLDVPSGPSRTIQLFATKSTVGCPDINTILNQMAANGGQVIGVDQPFLIAQTTVDVYSDTDVALDARNYNSATTVAMFNGCGGGGTVVPITLAQKGYFNSTATGTTPAVAPIFGSGELALSAPTPLTATELSLVSMLKIDNGTGLPLFNATNSMINSVVGTTTGFGARAIAQFVWDVTNFNISTIPVMNIDLQIGGPTSGTCTAVVGQGVQGGALKSGSTAAAQTWDTSYLNTMNSANLQWASLYRTPSPLLVPCSLVNPAAPAANQCVVVNVDSNILAPFGSACQSEIAVGGAQLTLFQTPQPVGLDIWPKSTTYYANSANGGGTNFNFNPRGGIPPYAITADGAPVPTPSASPTTWTTSGVGPHSVTVSDSSVPAHAFSFNFSTVAGLSYVPPTFACPPATTVTVPIFFPTIGGTNALTYSFMGGPPAGTTLAIGTTNGQISGTVTCSPSVPSPHPITVIATDTTGAQLTSTFTLSY